MIYDVSQVHSSVLAWRTPGTEEPGRLPSMGLHRVGHDWSDLAAAAAASLLISLGLGRTLLHSSLGTSRQAQTSHFPGKGRVARKRVETHKAWDWHCVTSASFHRLKQIMWLGQETEKYSLPPVCHGRGLGCWEKWRIRANLPLTDWLKLKGLFQMLYIWIIWNPGPELCLFSIVITL